MARKPLTKMQLQKKWNEKLRKAGLSMEKGRSKRLSYVGGTSVVEVLQGAQEMGTRSTEGDLDISYAKKEE